MKLYDGGLIIGGIAILCAIWVIMTGPGEPLDWHSRDCEEVRTTCIAEGDADCHNIKQRCKKVKADKIEADKKAKVPIY